VGFEAAEVRSNTPPLSVRLGQPSDNYDRIEMNGISIYYLPSLSKMFKGVTIKIEKLLFFKWLVVAGEKITGGNHYER